MTLRGGRQGFASLPEKLVEGYGLCPLEELSSLYLDRACPIIRGKEQEPKAGKHGAIPQWSGMECLQTEGTDEPGLTIQAPIQDGGQESIQDHCVGLEAMMNHVTQQRSFSWQDKETRDWVGGGFRGQPQG